MYVAVSLFELTDHFVRGTIVGTFYMPKLSLPEKDRAASRTHTHLEIALLISLQFSTRLAFSV